MEMTTNETGDIADTKYQENDSVTGGENDYDESTCPVVPGRRPRAGKGGGAVTVNGGRRRHAAQGAETSSGG